LQKLHAQISNDIVEIRPSDVKSESAVNGNTGVNHLDPEILGARY